MKNLPGKPTIGLVVGEENSFISLETLQASKKLLILKIYSKKKTRIVNWPSTWGEIHPSKAHVPISMH